MEVTPSNLDLIFRQANTRFSDAVAQTPTWYQDVCVEMPSQSRTMDYAWLDRIPQMRQWLGNRQIVQAQAHTRRVTNLPYESTLELDRFDIEDDMMGLYYTAVAMQGASAKKWPDTVVANFIRQASSSTFTDGSGNQTSNLGFDQVPLYSTAHPILGGVDGAAYTVTGASTQSNLFTGRALTYDNYVYVRTQMMSWVGADGLPLGIEPNVLMVPPALEQQAKLIIEAEYVPSTAGSLANGVTAGASPMTNTYRNSAKVFVNKQLANMPNNWWLLCTNVVGLKPFIWQLRSAPKFTQLTSPTDANNFMAHKFLYGVEARGASAESLWFLSAAGTSAATYTG